MNLKKKSFIVIVAKTVSVNLCLKPELTFAVHKGRSHYFLLETNIVTVQEKNTFL